MGPGHPRVYSDRLFLKALIIMIVRHLHKVNELLSVLRQETAEMQALRALLTEQGRYPGRRTWERRLSHAGHFAGSNRLLGMLSDRRDPALGNQWLSGRH